MNNESEYIPVPNSLSLTIRKNYKLMIIKRASNTVFRVAWKTLLYALLLTVANVIV